MELPWKVQTHVIPRKRRNKKLSMARRRYIASAGVSFSLCNAAYTPRSPLPKGMCRLRACLVTFNILWHFQNYLDSGPILVIVERETPDAAHTRHVGEDTYCPHARAANAGQCRPGQCGHDLSPHAEWLVPPSGRSPSCPVPPLAARLAMRPWLLRGPVPVHGRLAPGPAPRGERAGSGG